MEFSEATGLPVGSDFGDYRFSFSEMAPRSRFPESPRKARANGLLRPSLVASLCRKAASAPTLNGILDRHRGVSSMPAQRKIPNKGQRVSGRGRAAEGTAERAAKQRKAKAEKDKEQASRQQVE